MIPTGRSVLSSEEVISASCGANHSTLEERERETGLGWAGEWTESGLGAAVMRWAASVSLYGLLCDLLS